MKKVEMFGDGSALGNPGPGGYGTVIKFGKHVKELSGGFPDTTNNRMELLALIEGLKALKQPCEVHFTSDSQYVVKAVNTWLANWIKKNFAKVKNVDLWKEYVEVSAIHTVTCSWVKGHAGHVENERCDILARTAAEVVRDSM